MQNITQLVEDVIGLKTEKAQMSFVDMLELRRIDHYDIPLNESYQILIENRIDFVKTNLGPKITFDHDTTGKIKEPNALIDHIAAKVDPTASKAHTQWVGTQYAKGNIRQEDFPRVKKALKGFEMVKKNLVNKDINAFKTVSDLEDHVAVQKPRTESDIKAKSASAAEVSTGLDKQYESEHGTGFKIPNTKTSIAMYGSSGKMAQTNWCTAANSHNNMFTSYKGGKYTFHTPENNVLQFHHDSGQIMDVKDHHVNISSDPRFAPHAEGIKDFIRQTHGQEGFTTESPSSLYKKTGVGMTKEAIAASEQNAEKEMTGSYPRISRDHLDSLSTNPHSPEHFDKVHNFIKQQGYQGSWYDDHIKAQHSLTQNPNTLPHILKDIHDYHSQNNGDNHGILNALAGNPSLPHEIRSHYSEYPEFASRRDLTPHEIENISKDTVSSQKLAGNHMVHLPAHIQGAILRHGNATSINNLAHRPDVDTSVADDLFLNHGYNQHNLSTPIAKNMSSGVVDSNVAKLNKSSEIYHRDDISPHTKERMVMDGKVQVADIKPEHADLAVKGGAYRDDSLLASKHLSKDHAEQIGNRIIDSGSQHYNLNAVFNHPKMPEHVKTAAIRSYASSSANNGSDKFKEFTNIQPHHIDAILDSGNTESIRHIPDMKTVQKSHFDKMVDNKQLHGAIVNSKSAPPSVLSKLAATSTSDYIKSKIASHKNTPADVKASIKFDSDKV
jgi:hypothetical protein